MTEQELNNPRKAEIPANPEMILPATLATKNAVGIALSSILLNTEPWDNTESSEDNEDKVRTLSVKQVQGKPTIFVRAALRSNGTLWAGVYPSSHLVNSEGETEIDTQIKSYIYDGRVEDELDLKIRPTRLDEVIRKLDEGLSQDSWGDQADATEYEAKFLLNVLAKATPDTAANFGNRPQPT